jgi:hypothetical protein
MIRARLPSIVAVFTLTLSLPALAQDISEQEAYEIARAL